MKPRILILPVSALAIAALIAWRLGRESPPSTEPRQPAPARQLAPRFELYDQHSQLVKFERYLGRTRLAVLFVGNVPAADHPWALLLLDHAQAIEQAGVQVVIVGTATPFANRQAEEQSGRNFPFPVLTDVDLRSPIPAPTHRQWGLAGDKTDDVREGLFLIDRDGSVASTGIAPQPIAEPRETIEQIAAGDWPDQT